MCTWILPLSHWTVGLASWVWSLLGNIWLEIYFPVVSSSFSHWVVWGAQCIEVVIKGLCGAMGTFVVPKTVTHEIIYLPPTPPHHPTPSGLWLEQWISNHQFRLFLPLNTPSHTHPTPSFILGHIEEYPRRMAWWKVSLTFLGFVAGKIKIALQSPLFAPWWLWWFFGRWN